MPSTIFTALTSHAESLYRKKKKKKKEATDEDRSKCRTTAFREKSATKKVHAAGDKQTPHALSL